MRAGPDPALRARARARLADAARLLPVLGLALMLAPDVLLAGGGSGATAPWLVWLFGAWALLIGLSAVVARRHARLSDPPAKAPEP